jgi:hypothetical protein
LLSERQGYLRQCNNKGMWTRANWHGRRAALLGTPAAERSGQTPTATNAG